MKATIKAPNFGGKGYTHETRRKKDPRPIVRAGVDGGGKRLEWVKAAGTLGRLSAEGGRGPGSKVWMS